jgi:hypothetical protein
MPLKSTAFALLLFFTLGLVALKAQHHEHCPSCQHLKQELREAYLDWGGQKSLNINYNDRSDTFDILHYTINLKITNPSSGSVSANCEIQFSPKMNNLQQITLDLLRLTVDSIKMGNTNLSFTHNDTLIYANFPTPLNIGDTANIQVFYRGQPQADAMWGGFYFQGGYAFNLGVGFAADPHNYGRVWYPCFDNFVERATYTFNITTDPNMPAFCNGSLTNDVTNGPDRTRTWEMETPIPTYLSCVAAADYTVVHQNYSGLTGLVPIELVAKAADTSNMKNSFINLNKAMEAYEYWFGPYVWNKVGYSAVPFNSGAMEHATNIAYPLITLNGSLTYETLMAHELSHHWWGDLATCETAEDMWINEGMATYCEHLFLEYVYGWDRYIDEVKHNHYNVLQNAHLTEGGYRPISGVPHQYTYGDHVYKKGAAMAHNLRWYLGDSLFRMGMTAVLDSFALNDLSSAEMRDYLTQVTGVDLTDFFNDWVFNGGFSHFELDSMTVNPNGGNFDVNLSIQQKLKGAPNFHNNTPLQFSFIDDQWNREERIALVSGEFDQLNFSGLSFEPKMVIINENHGLNQARMDQARMIDAAGNFSFGDAKLMSFTVNAVTDSAYVHMAYHPVAPDSIFDNPYDYQISKNRYWSVRGIWDANFDAEFRIEPNSNLDSDLMANFGADSLILLYREKPEDPWREHPDYVKQQIASFNFMRVQTILAGDYALANGQMGLGVGIQQRSNIKESKIYPNPADSQLTIDLRLRKRHELSFEIYNLNGQLLQQNIIDTPSGKSQQTISLGDWPAGIYFLKIRDHKGSVLASHKFVKQ